MTMGHIQKILLLVLLVPLTFFPGGLIIYILFYEQLKFEMLMWVPVGLSLLGICSFIFHLKTLKIYKLYETDNVLPRVESLLWILDVLYGLSSIFVSGSLIYFIFSISPVKGINGLFLFILPMFIVGLWTLVEVVYLYNLIRIHKSALRQAAIDNIRGDFEN